MILKGKKIILRPIKLSDAPRFVKWLKDSEVNKFTTTRPISLKEEIKWIKGKSKNKNIERHFAIDTKENIHIGSTVLFLDMYGKSAKFGILIGDKNYWDKGYGTETTKLMLNCGFKNLKLHRIGLEVFEFNKRGIKVYERCGFKLEGRQREKIFWNKKFYDELQMGILRKEWQKLNKK